MSALSEAAVAALRGAVADERTVRLAVITDRGVYREVDRVLSRIAGGGRWDRRERAHVYMRDPRPELERLTGAAVMPPPVASRDKELSYWPTPPALAAVLAAPAADLGEDAAVLEPSAGDGALVRAIRDANPGVWVTAVEVDEGRARRLREAFRTVRVGVHPVRFQDYAAYAANAITTGAMIPFDLVVMNPPFTEPGNRYAWAEHLALAWGLLRPGGLLRAIVPASLEFGRQRPIAAARTLLREAGATWWPAPEGAFRASGTSVHTLVVEATR